MNQDEYLNQLGGALNMLSPEEISDVQSYYANSIRGEVLNGASEAQAIEHLGPADQVAQRILRTRTQQPGGMPAQPHRRKHLGLVIAGVVVAACIAVSSAGQAISTAVSGNQAAIGRQSFTATAAEVQTLSIDSAADDVTFSTSPDEDIHLEWTNSKSETHTAAQDGTGLALKTQTYSGTDFFTFSFSDEDTEIVVQLPEGYETDSLTIKTTSGEVNVNSISVKGDLSLTTTSGGVSGYDMVTQGALSVRTTSGDVYLTDSSLGSAELKSTSGYLDLSDCTVSGESTLESTSGDISWSDSALGGKGKFYSTSGEVQLSGISAKDAIQVGTTSGEVQVEMKNPASDYTISAKSVSGDIDIPNGKGTLPMDIETVSGDIQVEMGY